MVATAASQFGEGPTTWPFDNSSVAHLGLFNKCHSLGLFATHYFYKSAFFLLTQLYSLLTQPSPKLAKPSHFEPLLTRFFEKKMSCKGAELSEG
jgi:hypothetical protein